jgi:hypothetical protein
MVYQYGEILSNGLPIQVQYTTNLAVPMWLPLWNYRDDRV